VAKAVSFNANEILQQIWAGAASTAQSRICAVIQIQHNGNMATIAGTARLPHDPVALALSTQNEKEFSNGDTNSDFHSQYQHEHAATDVTQQPDYCRTVSRSRR
jgi:hypothetical protein